MSPVTKLNIRQRLAAQFLATGLTRDAAAKRVGCDPATLSKWRRLPIFDDYLNNLLALHEKESLQALQALKLVAVERLSELLGSPNPGIALRAVDTVLKQSQPIPQGLGTIIANLAWATMQEELERIAKGAGHVAA